MLPMTGVLPLKDSSLLVRGLQSFSRMTGSCLGQLIYPLSEPHAEEAVVNYIAAVVLVDKLTVSKTG